MAVILEQIIESNSVQIIALDDEPMNFRVRINGRLRHIKDAIYQMRREELREERGPITA